VLREVVPGGVHGLATGHDVPRGEGGGGGGGGSEHRTIIIGVLKFKLYNNKQLADSCTRQALCM
jgi:hypothetical protein